jgi:hypothetical protein
MKKVIIAMTAVCCSTNLLFSQVNDSLKTNSQRTLKNEIGISIDNINMNDFLRLNLKNVSLQYKHTLGHYSVRAGVYSYESINYISYNGYPDSVFNSNYHYTIYPNVLYHITQTVKNYGGTLGLQRNLILRHNLSFFYGMDFHVSHISNVSNVFTIYLQQNTNTDESYGTSIKPNNSNYHGYEIGIVPLAGITQGFSKHFSVSAELNLMFNIIKYQNVSMQNQSDVKAKVLLSYRI